MGITLKQKQKIFFVTVEGIAVTQEPSSDVDIFI